MIAPAHKTRKDRNVCWFCGVGMNCPHCNAKVESCGSHCPHCGKQYLPEPPQSKDPDDRCP